MRFLILLSALLGMFQNIMAENFEHRMERFLNLTRNARLLQDVRVIRVVDEETQKGVIARYRGSCSRFDWNKRAVDHGFILKWEKNKNKEQVFITGLDMERVTENVDVFNITFGVDERGLFVWYTGTVKLKIRSGNKSREVRLRKFTADPRAAAAFYAAEKQKLLKKQQLQTDKKQALLPTKAGK